jgi:hypothetical protein
MEILKVKKHALSEVEWAYPERENMASQEC